MASWSNKRRPLLGALRRALKLACESLDEDASERWAEKSLAQPRAELAVEAPMDRLQRVEENETEVAG